MSDVPAVYRAIRPRPTIYRGIQMKSRLEARFAAYLDSARVDWPWDAGEDWPWTYEPMAFADETGQYLPDFLVDGGDQRLYIEVRPPLQDGADRAAIQLQIILSSYPDAILAVAMPDGERWFWWYLHGDGDGQWRMY